MKSTTQSPLKKAMPAKAQGKGMSKMPPGIAKRIAAGKSAPAGISRTRAALLSPKEEPVALKNGGKVRKYQVGGAVLPAQAAAQAAQGMARRPAMPDQAAAQAAQGMARRPAMPTQAAGRAAFKNGGAVLPSKAAPQATQGTARRPAMPTQAAGARPFKKGGSVKKRK